MSDDVAEVAMVAIACRYCDAAPGEWCVTESGKRSGHLHSTRFYDWRETADKEPPAESYPNPWPPVPQW